MKMINALRLFGVVLVLALAVGCSGTTEEGPTAEDAAAAIAAAKAANEKAKAEGVEWRDTAKLIGKAEDAMKAEDYAKAIELANQARRQAENAVKQKYAEMNRLDDTAPPPVVSSSPSSDSYTVDRGDNLWNISGKPSVYGNPYQWPLIYKANSDKIKDADLIYPGQVLGIDSNPSSSDTSAAIQHAKTRGSWTIGTVEASDKAYLGN